MRKRSRTNLILGLVMAGWTAIACGSGSGAVPPIDEPYDRAPDSREKPPSSRDNPGDTRQAPPASTENPGSQGGGPGSSSGGGGGGGCPPCDRTFKCTEMAGGTTVASNQSLTLKTVNGTCQSVDKQQSDQAATLGCDGTITGAGVTSGSWQSDGNGGFTASVTGTQTVMVNGKTTSSMQITVTLACKASSMSTPTPTATVTATPVPTSTPVFDAGTNG